MQNEYDTGAVLKLIKDLEKLQKKLKTENMQMKVEMEAQKAQNMEMKAEIQVQEKEDNRAVSHDTNTTMKEATSLICSTAFHAKLV